MVVSNHVDFVRNAKKKKKSQDLLEAMSLTRKNQGGNMQ